MKKLRIVLICLILSVLLQSCNLTAFDTDTLLTPPQMNEVNREIRESIEAAVGGAFEPLYPLTGNHQSVITSVDMNSDNISESVCFYRSSNDKKANLIVLEQSTDKWNAIGMVKSQATDIDRVAFSDLDGDGKKEVVIGWRYTSGEERAIEIFKFTDTTEMKSVYTGMYSDFSVYENYVVSIARNTSGKTASAALIGKSKSGIAILNTVSLNGSISGFISIQGVTSDNGYSIYLDEQLDSLMYATEILTLTKNGELTVTRPQISDQTIRTRAYICKDIDANGSLDVPIERKLPEYKRGDTTESLAYVDWHTYKSGALQYLTSAYTSLNEQFIIELPDEWIGKITIQRDFETDRAIHFYKTENEEFTPMFSVRIFSQQEFSDAMKELGWVSISTANENVYAFRSDGGDLGEAFNVDLDRISELFSLIS